MSPYAKAWLAWGAGTAVSFAAIEAQALRTHAPGATLSAHLRLTFGFTDDRHLPLLRRACFFAGVGWLAWHVAEPGSRCVSRMAAPTPTA